MIQIFDNVLTDDDSLKLEQIFSRAGWYLSTADNHATVTKDVYDQYATSDTIESVQLTDFLFVNGKPNSPLFREAGYILQKFSEKTNTNINNLIRIKANLQIQQPRTENQHNTMHVDSYDPHLVMIYYVNDSDGNTIIFNNNKEIVEKIPPKRGRCLLFSGNQLHAGQPPINHKTRIVLNFNFL